MPDSNRTEHFLYGSGVFTSIRIHKGMPWRWSSHWRRLVHDAEQIGMDVSEHDEASVRRVLDHELEKHNVSEGRARVTLADERLSPIWTSENADGESPTSISVVLGELREVSDVFRLECSPYTVNSLSPLAGTKTCNYLEPLIAIEEAKRDGSDEAVRLNEHGHIVSACMANIFWLSEGTLFTPALSTGCLPGTTREFILEEIECSEVEAEISVLDTADAIFLTSAGRGVIQVSEYFGREMPWVDHAIKSVLPFNTHPQTQ